MSYLQQISFHHYVPGNVLEVGNMKMDKTDRNLCPHASIICMKLSLPHFSGSHYHTKLKTDGSSTQR